jgi:hypothetical protein
MSDSKDFSFTTEAINQILVEANCPNKFRQYIDCLVGVANKSFEFEASDLDIAKRARGRIDGTTKHADKGWARDKRRDLLEWQAMGNLKLIDYEPSDYDSKMGLRPKSLYKFHLLTYAEQVVNNAQKDTNSWNRDNSIAIQRAAQELVKEVLGQQVNTPKGPKYIDPPTEVKAKIRTARTNLQEAVRMLKKYDFKLMRDDEILVGEIEALIEKIKDRGYVDDILDVKIFTNIRKP